MKRSEPTMRKNAFLNGKKLIIDRYISREIIKPTLTICVVLIFIFGCYTASRYLAEAFSGQLPGTTVLLFILLRIAIALEVLLPTTLYLSVVIALGRMYKDSEMTALSACGVSKSRVLRPVFFVFLVIAVIVGCTPKITPGGKELAPAVEGDTEISADVSEVGTLESELSDIEAETELDAIGDIAVQLDPGRSRDIVGRYHHQMLAQT